MANSQRFIALDVFRGMTLCLMIIVNTPGDGGHSFQPLMHAKWHGFTLTDLVFPSFLFAVGNSISFAQQKWISKTNREILFVILKRTALIFILGFLMYWFPFFTLTDTKQVIISPISETRIMGVLQRIAICYGIASLLIQFLKIKISVFIGILCLFVYWGILYTFGDYTLPGNAVLKFDNWLMGENHLYRGEGIPFDPEGWLSTMPAIANVIAGYWVGKRIQQRKKEEGLLLKLIFIGISLILLAYLWNFLLPMNKKLWTSSFVLVTIGWDCMILSTIVYLTQILPTTKWTYFFEVFGKNTIFIYLLSELVVVVVGMIPISSNLNLFEWLYRYFFSIPGLYIGSLLFSVTYMLFCWSIGYLLDQKKIYIRV